MKKRWMAMLLTAGLCAASLAGCGSGNEGSGSSGAGNGDAGRGSEAGSTGQAVGSVEPGDYSEHLTITAWKMADDGKGYYSDYSENPVVLYLNEKFNVTLDFQEPPSGSEPDQFALMMMGDYTDVFSTEYAQDTMGTLYEDGIIQDLAPYLERYAPNYLAWIQSTETARKTAYDEEGHVFVVPNTADEGQTMWGGLMYRRDILETMTGGNVAFPSGGDEPTTVEDWDYMLGLMKGYFDAADMVDSACLIIPYQGYFPTSEILNGFGTSGVLFLKDGKVEYGPVTEEFYNYLVKMKEWYEKGYVYQDFASRVDDLLFMPNTALTFGGAAGVWFGLGSVQLFDKMSMPEYGLEVDVHAIASPVDEAHNASPAGALGIIQANEEVGLCVGGWAVSTACDEAKLIRWLEICDYLFTEEGQMVKTFGLTAEQAEGNVVYEAMGLADGMYHVEGDKIVFNPIVDPFTGEATIDQAIARGMRLPGLHCYSKYNVLDAENMRAASATWLSGGYQNCYPSGALLPVNQTLDFNAKNTAITDYVNSMVPKFIMGTEELTEESFAAYVEQINSLGLQECISMKQAAYDEYMAK